MPTDSNTVLSCLKKRRSCRAFVPGQMPGDDLLALVAEAGTYAATGRGAQSPQIIVVTNAAVRQRLMELNAQVLGTSGDPFYAAPAIIIVLADTSRPTYLYDGSLVMGNMMAAAEALGLGACWIHRAKEVFAMPEGRQMLSQWGIEGHYEGIGHLAIGYAAAEPAPAKPRREGYVKWVR